jgi:hypothetical protein
MTGPKRVRLWTSISTERLDARVLERIELVQDRANVVDSSLTAPQILRAMENLKLALRLRLSRGPLNEEQINAAAALIDAAATGVEQII